MARNNNRAPSPDDSPTSTATSTPDPPATAAVPEARAQAAPAVAHAYKARTVIGVIVTKLPDGSTSSREIGAVEAIRRGEAIQGPILTFGSIVVGPRPTLGHIGDPPEAMLADDRVLVTCPCGDAWPGSTQDRMSARAPEKAKPRHDHGERVGPGYMLRKRELGQWPDASCRQAQERLAFKLQHPGELAVAAAKARGEKDPVELEKVRAIAVARATGLQGGSSAATDAVFAAARADVARLPAAS